MIKFNEFRENKLKEDVGKTSFQELADSSGHLIVKRSPINVAKTQKKEIDKKKAKESKGSKKGEPIAPGKKWFNV